MARRKRKEVEAEYLDETSGVNPLPVVLWSAASLAGAFIMYNIFAGQPSDAVRLARQYANPADIADGISQKGNQNTVVLHYDPTIEAVQRELLATGQYRGLVDGVNGNRTRLAIEAYEKANDLPVVGQATAELLDHIRFTRKFTDAAQFTASTDQSDGTMTAGQGPVARVQRALADLGYEPGDATGNLNDPTRAALRKFQSQRNLPVDGEISAAVLAELAKTTGYEDLARPASN